jgi:hypothetical protein
MLLPGVYPACAGSVYDVGKQWGSRCDYLIQGPGCHPERSEGSREPAEEILRCAQDDRPYLQMSVNNVRVLPPNPQCGIIIEEY